MTDYETPWAFCRYYILLNDQPLSPPEQFDLLVELRGKMFPHRKAQPTLDDHDTTLVMPALRTIDSTTVLRWCVGQQITVRIKSRYQRDSDMIVPEMESADEMIYTRFIALPALGVVAIMDMAGDRWLNARSGAARFRTVVASVTGCMAVIEPSGSTSDMRKALDTWSLDQFQFSVRPFNPTPRRIGEQLHAWMKSDGIGVLRGVALPAEGGAMHSSEDGFITEAAGLASEGYGQIGLRGRTPDGHTAQFRKPSFGKDKKLDEQRQAKPQALRVFVPRQVRNEDEEAEVARALLRFYG